MKTKLILLLCCCALAADATDLESLQCKNENGTIVDWYVLYKLPKISSSSNPLIRQGVAYAYITNATVNQGWKLSTRSIKSALSIPGRTLDLLYKDNVARKIAWLLYSDQAPDVPAKPTFGHAKGAVVADLVDGFWMIHSVPNFPSDTRYHYPDSGERNGQSFLCISIKSEELDVISPQLVYNQVIPYSYHIPEDFPQRSSLVDVSQRPTIRNPPFYRKQVIKSMRGTEFTSFAKTSKWQRELYGDFVAPQLQASLMVESWQNGRGKLPSKCQAMRVYNVDSILLEAANIQFSSTLDHSKWAVTASNRNNKNWICIGDINRADGQLNRGGGTVCLNSSALRRAYKGLINDYERCPEVRKQVSTTSAPKVTPTGTTSKN
ncbi:plancitoxin-1-like [Diachasmimorpha longicaudata]|uniref:plancitoxin-1-like n=1 Tax=Diachasmimorpha longicaudata TaxID=58733 RepID=UPI0030B8FEFA